MVKRNDGRKRKPLKRKKTDYAKNADGVKRRRLEPKRRFNNIKLSDIDYIDTE